MTKAGALSGRRRLAAGVWTTGMVAIALVGGPRLAVEEVGAQEVVRETQLPLVPEEGVVEIGPDLRIRLGLFPELPSPLTVRLFEEVGGRRVLELESRTGNLINRERRAVTPAELAELRQLVVDRFGTTARARPLDQEGRGGLVLGHTLMGLTFYGWAVPAILDVSTGRGVLASYLLTSGAAFLLPYRLTGSRAVSDGHRALSLYGATRGTLYGVLVANAFIDDGGEDDSNSFRGHLGGALLGSVAGSFLGFAVAERTVPDQGSAALWTAMGDVGLAVGSGLAYVAGPYTSKVVSTDPFGFEETEILNPVVGHVMTLAGGVAGLMAGKWLGEREAYTTGNVRALQSAVVLGAQAGLAAVVATGTDEGRLTLAGALVGGGSGLVLGNGLLRGHRFTNGEGLLINAAHVAGGATALGITYLMVEDFADHPKLYTTTSMLGSAFGAALVFRALGVGSAGVSSAGGVALRF